MNIRKKSKKATRREGWKKAGLLAALASLLLPTIQPAAYAFSGEDPLNGNPWHHEVLTEDAAKADKGDIKPFSVGAADTVAWHADYIDSYLYNPLWWLKGGMDRFKASMATAPELEKLHFDDLFSADQARFMWRRYLSGTLAGLLWAKEQNGGQGDAAQAQNIVGVSLHAIQDFYSHSNWVDDPARRNRTFFEIPIADRPKLALYTGAYEHPEHLGVKHHGKISVSCSVMNQPGLKEMMEGACSGISPLSNSGLCEQFSACKKGQSVQPSVDLGKILGTLNVPKDVIYMAPPGIALDNKWVSGIGVNQRGLTDLNGEQAFGVAYELAKRSSIQWLTILEKEMNNAGAGRFWQQVKTADPSMAAREGAYEKLDKLPYTFLSAGKYPATPHNGQEYYLRVRLKTADESTAGTDADIRLKAAGPVPDFVLDYMPRANPVIAYNDFERGDNTTYVVGPFAQVPASIELFNDAATHYEQQRALATSFSNAVNGAIDGVRSLGMSIMGGHADWIGINKKVWMPDELNRIGTSGEEFSIEVNGGDQGRYRVRGRINKTGESLAEGWNEFAVTLGRLDCIKESTVDRWSSSDEPFVMSVLTPLPGANQPFKTEPFKGMDTGESQIIGHTFQTVRVPKDYGMLNLPINVMEHDDEKPSARAALLEKFAGKIESESADEKRGFLDAVASARAADWKLEHMEVYAFNREGMISGGTVYNAPVNRWIKGRERVSFALNTNAVTNSGVRSEDLLPYIPFGSEPGTAPIQTPTPTTPVEPPPTPTVPNLALLQKFVGKWQTNLGVLTFTLDGDKLRGVAMRRAIPQGREYEHEKFELRASADASRIEGSWAWSEATYGTARLTLSADGDRFDAVSEDGTWTEQQRKFLKPWEWTGTRIKDAAQNPPATTGGTTTGGPTTGTPTTGTPTTGGTTGGGLPIGGGPVAGTSTLAGTSVKVGKRIYMPREPITLEVAVPETLAATAWVGIIPSDIPHGKEGLNDKHDIDFKYLEDRPTRTLTFDAPTKVGNYDFRLNEGTGANGREIATVSFQIKAATADNPIAVTMPKMRFHAGEKFTITFKVPPFLVETAWIGIVPADISHGKEALNDKHDESFHYFDKGLTEGQFEFEAPSKPGNYDMRINDSFGNEIFSTVIFKVGAAPEE